MNLSAQSECLAKVISELAACTGTPLTSKTTNYGQWRRLYRW